MMEINERFADIRASTGLNKRQFADSLGINQSVAGDIELGKRDPSREVMLKLASVYNVDIHWLLTGKGPMFWPEDDQLQVEVYNSGPVNGSINTIGKVSGNNAVTISSPEPPILSVTTEAKMVRNMSVFEIPLLTKEQVLHFDAAREIPNPKAHSGEYPDYMLVPMPKRFVEYSSDLRAIVVFNGLMSPLLNPGDVAVFQVTSWSGDGVYMYRMKGDLYMSHVKSSGATYRLTKEFRADEEIPWEGETFEAIGRVRAVVREIP
jgi:DNA-binding XRE family transcriptional regulator